jgi:hypothetical protein
MVTFVPGPQKQCKPRIAATLTNQGPFNGGELYPIFTVTVDGGRYQVQPFFGGTAAQCACPQLHLQ